MNDIKPIETNYKGYRFRSRLEARWAVFFNSLGIEWRYESQGFKNELGDCYLPDFYLPRTKTWVEVKGDPHALRADWERMARLLDFGGVLPGFCDSYGTSRGLLLLGDVPESASLILHPIIQHHKGLVRAWAAFKPQWIEVEKSDALVAQFFGVEDEFGLDASPDGWGVSPVRITAPLQYEEVRQAYAEARGARFEHGEWG